ncbi:MAG: ATP-grasp domain-containing protein [Chloroflexi bacterium]|nr:ATP-grasp domain-containing protein [Chloroflexota bacterium]
MKLQEYQAKSILKSAGIPLPASTLATNAVQVKRIAAEIGYPVVLKAQTLESGRGSAGGVRIVHNEREIENISNEIFKVIINRHPVQFILVEKALTFMDEFYLAVISDLENSTPILRISEAGGATFLESSSFEDALVVDRPIDINTGLKDYQIREAITKMGIDPQLWKQFQLIAHKAYEVYRQYDATLVELNSLVLTEQNQVFVLDARISIDSQSLFRQESFADAFDPTYFGWEERQALKYYVDYHIFPGEVGCIVNGMGLAYLTLDQLLSLNTLPAAMIDIRGGATSTSTASSLEMLLLNPRVKVVLINIFGGMTRCDEAANGFLQALNRGLPRKPIFIRLEGTNGDSGLDLLHNNENMSFFGTTEALVNATAGWLRGEEL